MTKLLPFAKLFSSLALLLIAFSSYPQEAIINGKVVDLISNAPLQYVNISLLHGNYHTSSDAKGFFSIQADTSMLSDTVYFSSVGYASRLVPLKEVNNMEVKLIPLSVPLQEVAVTAKKVKKKTYTIDPFSAVATVNGINLMLLNDTGYSKYLIVTKYFRRDRKMTKYKYLKGVGITENYNCQYTNCDNWKLLLRIFDEDTVKSRPGVDLLNVNIVVTKDKEKFYKIEFPFTLIEPCYSAADSACNRSYYVALEAFNKEPRYYGFIYVDLEKYKIPIPKRGLYAGFEILAESGACGFNIPGDPSKEVLIWAARKHKGKLVGLKKPGRLRISLEVTE